jgi:hypothetical protein
MSAHKNIGVYWAIIALLLLTVAGLLLKFVVLGKTEMAGDGRKAIILDPSERAVVLNEMRQFLAGIQGILDAANRGDAQAIANIARPLGMSASHHVPFGLAAKLPLEFKTLGYGVHSDFDRLAMDADAMRDVGLSLRQLSNTMKKCVACHAAYQIATAPAPRR